jgi:hypothetical protein
MFLTNLGQMVILDYQIKSKVGKKNVIILQKYSQGHEISSQV